MKRLISTALAICLLLPAGILSAGAEEAAPVSLYYKNFEEEAPGIVTASGTGVVSLLGGTAYNFKEGQYTVVQEDERQYLRMQQITGDGGGYPLWRVTVQNSQFSEAKAIVTEYRIRLNINTTGSYLRSRSGGTYGTYMPYFSKGNILTRESDNGEIIGAYETGDWVTVTSVHYINSEDGKAKCDLWINGEYQTTVYDASYAGANDYLDCGGNYFFNFSIDLGNDSNQWIDIDYVKVYTEPVGFEASVINADNAETDVVTLRTNSVLILEDQSDCFTVLGQDGQEAAHVTGCLSGTDWNAPKGEGMRLNLALDSPLEYGRDYRLKIDGLCDIAGHTLTTELPFTTRPLRIYGEQPQLRRGGQDLTALSDGAVTVTMDYFNEGEVEENPLLLAALYQGDGQMTGLWCEEGAVGSGQEGQTLTLNLNLQNTAGQTLRAFAVRSRTDFTPVSAAVCCDASGLSQGAIYNPAWPVLRDSISFSSRINGDTQEITTAADAYTEALNRQATVLVLREGKTLDAFDDSNPMDSVLYVLSDMLTGEGFVYRIPDVRGNYSSYLFPANSEAQPEAVSIEYFGTAFMEKGKETIRNITAKEVESFLNDYAAALSLDIAEYQAMTQTERDRVNASVEAVRMERTDKVFSDYAVFMDALKEGMELCNAKTGEEIKEILVREHGGSTAYKLLESTLKGSIASEIFTEVLQAEPLTYRQMGEKCNEQTVLVGIQRAQSYTQTAEILTKMADVIGINLSAYQGLSADKQKKVCVFLAGRTYTGLSALASAFNSAVSEQSGTTSSGGSRNTGGSRTGGSTNQNVIMDRTPAPTQTPSPTTQPEETKGFQDLDGYDWAADAIHALQDAGIIQGRTADTFAPESSITRAEFTKLAVELYHLTDGGEAPEFNDVPQDAWYAGYVKRAASRGLISGNGDGSFGPEDTVTREMAAVILHRAALNEGASFEVQGDAYNDSGSISDWAVEAVAALSGAGILHGDDAGSFRPASPLTRAEAAVLMYNMVKWEGLTL